MKKILFMIHDLGGGGAEKVLVNLVNNMDKSKYDITVMALFGGGVNEKFLSEDIKLIVCHKKAIKGNSHMMKLFSAQQLFKKYVKESYDIIVSYLEGPTARIVSGCGDKKIKLVSWIHSTMKNEEELSAPFKNIAEAKDCYNRFNRIICVSNEVKTAFSKLVNNKNISILYNTNESEKIIALSGEKVNDIAFDENEGNINLCSVGRLIPVKSYDRLIRIHRALINDGLPVHTYVLGTGEMEPELRKMIAENNVEDSFTLLGYKENPYKYVKKCDVFVCSSWNEGFSTATTEALILGRAIITTDVSGMNEMLCGGEYGIITENSEKALYVGLKNLLSDRNLIEDYKKKSEERAKNFSTENTVKAVCEMFENL